MATSLDWKRATVCAVIAFVTSRALILLAMLLATGADPDALKSEPDNRPVITVSMVRISSALARISYANDAGWYHGIAEGGYSERPFDLNTQENWAFFPLHPLIWRAAIAILGDHPATALVLANLFALLALTGLHLATRASGRDAATADRAVFVLAFFPTSYFLSLPWTESLFIACSTVAWVAAARSQWGAMGLAGAAASATRFSGVFLLPAVFLQFWWRRPRKPFIATCALLLVPAGTMLFMLWLWIVCENPMAFSDIQSAWGRSVGLPIRAIGIVLLHPGQLAVDWNFRYLNLAAFALGLLSIRHFLYRREFGFAALVAAGVLHPAMTDSLTSMGRYALGCFPLMIAIADWTQGRMSERLWFAGSAALLLFMAGALTLDFSFAAA